MVDGSAGASHLPTFSAPNKEIRRIDSFIPSIETTSTTSRTGDKSLSSFWIQRLNPRDIPRVVEISGWSPAETCGDIEASEKPEKKKTKSSQSSEAISTVGNSDLIKPEKTQSWWKCGGSGTSPNAEDGTKSTKQENVKVLVASSGFAGNREILLKKKQTGFLRSSYGFEPPVSLMHNERNVIVQQSEVGGVSSTSDAKSKSFFTTVQQTSNSIAYCNPDPAATASVGFTKPLLPPMPKNFLFYLRHIHEKKRGISFCRPSLNDISRSSIQQLTFRDQAFQTPQDVIRADLAADGSSQMPCIESKYSKGLSETTGSISEHQLSALPTDDLGLKLSHGDLGIKNWESKHVTANMEPRVTMLCLESSQVRRSSDGEDRNVLTAFDLCVKSSHASQHNEERVHKRARYDSLNQTDTNAENGILRDGFVLDLNIDVCADKIWSHPSPRCIQSEQRDVVGKKNVEPSRFLDVMLKSMTAKQEKGTICFIDGISEQTVGFSKDQLPQNHRLEQSSSIEVFPLRPKFSFDLNEEYTESASVDELETLQNPCEIKENICGKSQRDIPDDLTSQGIAEKYPTVQSPSMYQIWIQRWRSATFHNEEGLSSDARVLIDGGRRNCYRYLALGVSRIFTTGMIHNASAENDQLLEDFKSSYAKATPSAAAMAIVGTAARQFCNISSQQKRSFGFWSGLGKGN